MAITFPTKEQIGAYLQAHDYGTIQASLYSAQNMFFKAMDCKSKKKVLEHLEKALKKSPLCADVYTFYADCFLDDNEEKLAYLDRAIYAGEMALDAPLKAFEGIFWDAHETRPYMRARESLAKTLWRLGRHEESIKQCRAMLDLNPNDNQGIRHFLLGVCLTLKQMGDVKKLFLQYPEDYTPDFLYAKALLAYRDGGDLADELAQKAIKYNPHVPKYLKLRVEQPEFEAGYYPMGGEEEAKDYINGYLSDWMDCEGAIDWLCAIQSKLD